MKKKNTKKTNESNKILFKIKFEEIMKVLYKEIDRKKKFNDS